MDTLRGTRCSGCGYAESTERIMYAMTFRSLIAGRLILLVLFYLSGSLFRRLDDFRLRANRVTQLVRDGLHGSKVWDYWHLFTLLIVRLNHAAVRSATLVSP